MVIVKKSWRRQKGRVPLRRPGHFYILKQLLGSNLPRTMIYGHLKHVKEKFNILPMWEKYTLKNSTTFTKTTLLGESVNFFN